MAFCVRNGKNSQIIYFHTKVKSDTFVRLKNQNTNPIMAKTTM